MKTFIEFYDEKMVHDPDFRGYHCSDTPTPDGVIHRSYSETDWFPLLLDSLPYDLRLKSMEMGIFEAPDKYSEERDEWAEKVEEFFYENGIRWIFVSTDQPYGLDRSGIGGSYGRHCFYVFMKEQDMLMYENDHQEENADVIVYHVNKPPRFIPIPED